MQTLAIKKKSNLKSLLIALIGIVVVATAAFGVSKSFAAACPCTVFTAASTPAQQNINDGQPLELGMKFNSEVAGTVTGVRFYKGSSDTGSHTGNLWSSTGTKLGSVTFTGESASGWQQANFTTPITVAANTTYIVSYFSSAGYYTATSNGFASAVDNTPLHGLASGTSGGNGLYKYGATGFPTSSWNASNYWVDAVFMNNPPADTTPPTITSVVPAASSTNIAVSTNVTATVSEALDPATVTSATATVSTGGNSVAATVTYDAANKAIVIDPTTDLAAGTNYTAMIKSGANGVKDTAGNALAADYTWTFATTQGASAFNCPCSIWADSEVPVGGTFNDNQAIELGTKFQATTTGYVTGLQFYKPTGATGTYTGSLWASNGTKLASVTYTGTTDGWQTATLANPVAIQAGVTYVVSYNTSGTYFASSNYFTTAHDSAPLSGLASGTSGGNGVYTYGTNTMPTNSFNSTNYWADVVFTDQAIADTTAPTVSSVVPGAGSAGASTRVAPTATFSEPVNSSTVTGTTFTLKDASGSAIPATVSYDIATLKATLAPSSPLATNTTYTATIKGGTSGVKDTAGNALAADYTWTFTTSNSLAPDQGYGGPVLILTSSANKFSTYYAEILRAEGYNSFALADISTVSDATLASYKVIILGETALTDAQVTTLTTWVNAGGNLIAMRPDSKLAGLAGLTASAQTRSDAYLQIDTSTAPGAGIVGQTIQYHGAANEYTLNGAAAVATLFSDPTTSVNKPAVTLHSVGSNGGQVAVFAYDLAKSIVYTHQGNPAWAGQERDGSSPIRPNDLFYGNKAGDVQPDYVNLDKVAIPQADEQQRLLANVIAEVEKDSMPIAKWWYLPNGKKAALLMAADDHANGGTTGTFDRLRANENCNVANWECNRATSLMYTNTNVTPAQADFYNSIGFELGVHVNTGCSDWTNASLTSAFTSDLAGFSAKYPNLPRQSGTRTHCIAWSDWATSAKVENSFGTRLDLNYYYWPTSWVQNRGGFFTGSGTPMRFADTDGTMIDTYQVPTHLVNESGLTAQAVGDFLDRAIGPEGYYGVFGTHYDYSDNFDQTLQQLAAARGITTVSSKQVLDWTDARNSSTMKNMAWNGSELTFTTSVDARAGSMLRTMLPVTSNAGTLTAVTRDGTPVTFTTEVIKGINYAFFPGVNGAYVATYTNNTPPTIASSVPAANATGVAVDQTATATVSKALNPATVTTTTATIKNPAGTVIPSAVTYDAATKKISIDPTANLANSTVYTVTLSGGANGIKDTAGNALAANYTWSFTTVSSATLSSVFAPTATPALVNLTDNQPIELGMKFRSTAAGTITAIRFYKGSADTGTHTGSLWSSTGTKLGSVTFTGETASGWQQATLTTPIAVAANTTYVVSYYSTNGYYTATNAGFNTAVTNGVLSGLASGSSGGNGVYKYGASGFPTSSWNASNYWVDIVLSR